MTSRLRVLHLGRFYRPHAFGGIERHVTELLRVLTPQIDVDNLVAADSRRGDCVDLGAYRVFRAPSFGVVAGTACAPAMLGWARRLHATHPYQIIHLHFPDPLSQWIAQSLPRSIRRVVTWHCDIVRQRHLLKLYRPWRDHFLRDVDAVVAATPAHFTSSHQMDAVPMERRHVIPFGMDFARFDAPAVLRRAAQLRAEHAAPYLIFTVGRHVYYKGFEFLIDALQRLPQAQLVLGGQGPLTTSLKQHAHRAGVAERVLFTGRLEDQELAAWYHACDVFCMPSVNQAEAFGLVQLEAMACGKPVVCTDLGNGVNDLCPDGVTGLTARPGDAASLAACLAHLQDDPAWRGQLGATARTRARTEFSAAAMGQATLALYAHLAGS